MLKTFSIMIHTTVRTTSAYRSWVTIHVRSHSRNLNPKRSDDSLDAHQIVVLRTLLGAAGLRSWPTIGFSRPVHHSVDTRRLHPSPHLCPKKTWFMTMDLTCSVSVRDGSRHLRPFVSGQRHRQYIHSERTDTHGRWQWGRVGFICRSGSRYRKPKTNFLSL